MSYKNIGIIGGGHLGLAVAKALCSHGHDTSRLRISLRESGNSGHPSASHTRLVEEGFAACLRSNRELIATSDLILLCLRPADVEAFAATLNSENLSFGADTTVVSIIAGWRIETLSRLCNHTVDRVMLSGAPSVEEGEGVCALYPEKAETRALFAGMGLKIYGLNDEDSMHAFTAAVCLPAAFLQAEIDRRPVDEDRTVAYFTPLLSQFAELFAWAKTTTPRGLSPSESRDFITRLATKGGITERIVAAVAEGENLIEALERGVARGREIASAHG